MTLLLIAAMAAAAYVVAWASLRLVAWFEDRPRREVSVMCGICGWRDHLPTFDAAEAALRSHAAVWHLAAPEGVDP